MQITSLLKKGLMVGTILLFISIAIIPTYGQMIEKQSPSDSRGNILYVGGNGPGNYTRIQDAIIHASDGDTVFVYHDKSPYYEHVTISHSIHLIGEDRNTTVIDGHNSGDVVKIYTNNVTISGFTVQNGCKLSNNAGIMALYQSYNTIIHNNIFNNSEGILLGGWGVPGGFGPSSSYNNISDNNISYNNFRGVYITGVNYPLKNIDNVIQGNIISHNNGGGIGVRFFSTFRTKIINNKIFNNGGGGIYCASESDEICYNEIYSNKGGGIIYEYEGTNVTISHNRIYQNSGYGIYLYGRFGYFLINFTISKNDIELNSAGIVMSETMKSKIMQNNIYHNIVNAFIGNSLGNKWDGNYWGPLNRIKIIGGFVQPFGWQQFFPLLFLITVPSFNVDWHPVQKPYDIP